VAEVLLHNRFCQQHQDVASTAAAAAVAARYIMCVVAKTTADGRSCCSLSSPLLQGMLLGLPLLQPCWLDDSVATGRLLPVETRHMIKVGSLWHILLNCCRHT
jgi:hypothetical protein